jgi:hypothetical protein
MARIPDNTKLVHMNLPGVHDAATGDLFSENLLSRILIVNYFNGQLL